MYIDIFYGNIILVWFGITSFLFEFISYFITVVESQFQNMILKLVLMTGCGSKVLN